MRPLARLQRGNDEYTPRPHPTPRVLRSTSACGKWIEKLKWLQMFPEVLRGEHTRKPNEDPFLPELRR